jgi:hypothetical protein
MKMTGPTTSLPQASNARLPARGIKQESGKSSPIPEPAIVRAERPQGSGRPVRISRFPEEAALFAYSRHAEVTTEKNQAQIDEYV